MYVPVSFWATAFLLLSSFSCCRSNSLCGLYVYVYIGIVLCTLLLSYHTYYVYHTRKMRNRTKQKTFPIARFIFRNVSVRDSHRQTDNQCVYCRLRSYKRIITFHNIAIPSILSSSVWIAVFNRVLTMFSCSSFLF